MRGIGMAAALAASVGLAVPAEAQWRGHRPYRHHRGGIDGGDVLLGALLAGGVIAAVSAANAGRQRDLPVEPPLPRGWEDPDGPDGSFDGQDDDLADDNAASLDGESAAADACADAAEAEGRRLARRAEVSEVTNVDRAGDGWFVAGRIVLSGDAEVDGTERGFRCNVIAGQTPDVRIDGGVFAAR